jgi:hypothetical protein
MVEQWQAKWIWFPEKHVRKNSFVEFRNVWQRPQQNVGKAMLHISARNEYILYLNGVRIGRGPSPCDASWQYYDSYDVTDRLVEGDNVFAVVCYHFGEPNIVTGLMQGEAGLMIQLELDGEPVMWTDERWKSRYSPRWSTATERISQWNGFREIYIASREDGWEALDYDDSAWPQAIVKAHAGDPESRWPRLIPREIPFLRLTDRYVRSIVRTEDNFGRIVNAASLADRAGEPVSVHIDASKPGAFPAAVVDFGQEVVGYPEIRVLAPEGGVLRIAYGESLELTPVDTFILKSGQNVLQPFGRRACRFMRLEFSATPVPVTVNGFKFVLTHYDFPFEGSFETNDPLLNQIWEISKYTTMMNSQEHLEDCPWREKALWVVDAIVMGKVIYSTFADSRMLRKCLLQGARIQNEDGSIPGTGPERNNFLLPDFCAYWLLGVRDYYRYTADASLVAELWPAMEKLAAWFENQTDETGLFARANRPGMWCFIDWTEDVDRRDKVAAISFLYYHVLRAMEELAHAAGRGEASGIYGSRAERLRGDIRSRLWLKERRVFSDCIDNDQLSDNVSLQTNFLAVWSGLTEPEETQYFLREVYLKGALPPVKGPFFQHIVLEVLHREGLADEAIRLIREYWGEMVARGATTWWETFDASTPHCTIPSTYQGNTPTYLYEAPPVSLCHAWGSSPAYMLTRMVLGVDVSGLGHKGILLSKPANGLEWAKGTVPLPEGSVHVEWSRNEAGAAEGTVTISGPYSVDCGADYPLQIIHVK